MVKVKVCGLINISDAETALRCGADFLGFIVDVPIQTPRRITLSQVAQMLQEIDRKKVVIVLMPSTLREVEAVFELKPFGVQFHGNETPEFMEDVGNIAGKTKLIKAIHVKKGSAFEELKAAVGSYSGIVNYLLFDTQTDKLGGTGETHDWNIARKLVESIDTPVFLSGGLNPKNVSEAVRTVMPYGIDVSSGVELRPGFKDEGKIRQLITEVGRCST
jgi:phosphoribosylanthranilate isomerase